MCRDDSFQTCLRPVILTFGPKSEVPSFEDFHSLQVRMKPIYQVSFTEWGKLLGSHLRVSREPSQSVWTLKATLCNCFCCPWTRLLGQRRNNQTHMVLPFRMSHMNETAGILHFCAKYSFVVLVQR